MSDGENTSKSDLDFSAAAAAVTAYQTKLLEIAQANMQFAFEYAQALAAVRSPLDIISVTSEYTKRRLDMFNKHTKELADLAVKR